MSEIPWNERELRKLMVKACGQLAQKNFVAATDGNVSAKLGPDRVLVTPSEVSKGDVRENDIVLCDMEGRKIRGRGKVTSEVHVHLAAYRNRADIGGVVHAHPPVATAFTYAGLEDLLQEPIVPEVVAQIGPIPTAPYLTPGTRALAESVGPYFKQCDVVMLARHGAVTVGPDPWAAYLRMEKLEQFAVIVKTAFDLAGGNVQQIKRFDAQQVADLRASYGKGRLNSAPAGKDAELNPDELVARIATEVLNRLGRAG